MTFIDWIYVVFWIYVVLMAVALIWLFTLLILETRDRWREKKLEEKMGRK